MRCRPRVCDSRTVRPIRLQATPAFMLFEMTLPRMSSVWMFSILACERKLVKRRHSKLQHT